MKPALYLMLLLLGGYTTGLATQLTVMKKVMLGMMILFCESIYGQKLVIHFDFDKYDLNPTALTQLDSFLAAAHEIPPGAAIRLEGHCDFIGSDDYNYRLSLNRVKEVKKWFDAKGKNLPTNVTMTGYGKRKPLNDNRTADERSLNRRVEITIVPGSSTAGIDSTKSSAKKNGSLKKQIADTAVRSGSTITLRNINFEGGRHVFLPEAYSVLDELLETMNAYPSLVIEIRGNICCLGGDVDGLDADTRTYSLSEERAKAVYSYLISHGIKAERLSYKGYGHSFPIYAFPEQNEEERIANRRVEIKIVSK